MEERRESDGGKIGDSYVRLSNKSTILTINQVSQDSQAWRKSGGNMEEGL